MKSKRFLMIVGVLFLALTVAALPFIGACAPEEVAPPPPPPPPPPAEEEEAPPAPPEFQWPRDLRVATAMTGATAHMTATSWTPVLDADTGMKVRIIPEGSLSIKNRWFKLGVVDMMWDAQSEVGFFMPMAVGDHASRDGGPHQFRVVWTEYLSLYGFAVRGDTDIETIWDIRPDHTFGRRPTIVALDAGPRGLMSWIGVECKGREYATISSQMADFIAGKIDIVYVSPNDPKVVEAAAGPLGLRFIDLPYDEDPEGARRFEEIRGPTVWGKAWAAAVGQAVGVKMLISPRFMYAPADMDPEFVYQYVKWLDENFERYKDKFRTCETMSLELFRDQVDVIWIPLHEGTIRYLKEKGLWTADDDARQEANVELLTKWVNAYEAAIAEADKQGIKIAPANKEWMDLWASFKKDLPVFGLE